MKLRWRYNGIGPTKVVLEVLNDSTGMWEAVPIEFHLPLTDNEVAYHRAHQGDGVTIIR